MNLPVRIKPGASATSVGGTYPGPYGEALVVAVTAPAVDGRANEAVIKAVAAALGVKPATVRIRAGATARNKILEITDPPPGSIEILARLGLGTGV